MILEVWMNLETVGNIFKEGSLLNDPVNNSV